MSIRMMDIHCHVLPQVDDGASSWEVSEAMCRMAAEDGITHLVATPHANYEYPYDREQNLVTAQQLQQRVGGVLQILLGCDFHFSYDNIQEALKYPSRYTIGDTSYLLVELSDYSIPPMFLPTIEQLRDKGLRPILTHPERNPLLQRRPEQVLEWVQAGTIVQVTANSLTGFWGRSAQNAAFWLLDHQAVHVVATDAHDAVRRPPKLSTARRLLADRKGEEVATALVQANPAAVLANAELPYFPPSV